MKIRSEKIGITRELAKAGLVLGIGAAAIKMARYAHEKLEFSRVHHHTEAKLPLETVFHTGTKYHEYLRQTLSAFIRRPEGANIGEVSAVLAYDLEEAPKRTTVQLAAKTLQGMGILAPTSFQDPQQRLSITPELLAMIPQVKAAQDSLLTPLAAERGYSDPASPIAHEWVLDDLERVVSQIPPTPTFYSQKSKM